MSNIDTTGWSLVDVAAAETAIATKRQELEMAQHDAAISAEIGKVELIRSLRESRKAWLGTKHIPQVVDAEGTLISEAVPATGLHLLREKKVAAVLVVEDLKTQLVAASDPVDKQAIRDRLVTARLARDVVVDSIASSRMNVQILLALIQTIQLLIGDFSGEDPADDSV